MTITTHHQDAKTQYYKRVACETYDDTNGVYLELRQDHASFLIFDKDTREVKTRVRVNDETYAETKSFYEVLADKVNHGGLITRLKTRRWRNGRYSFEWAFYKPNGLIETISLGTQYIGA